MKVKCVKLLNESGKEVDFSISSLKLGHVYHVMSIYIDLMLGGQASYRVIVHEAAGEWPRMVLHPSECFEIVSENIPSNWGVDVLKKSAIRLGPVSWQESKFLEKFYDHDPEIYTIFKREQEIIIQEDP